jgi:diguanylate cyclase (GGDEF)-like protein
MLAAAHSHMHGSGHGLADMALMVVVACAVSYAILDAACRVRAAHGRARLAWLIGGSLVVGLSIWAMHFVALLSLRVPLPMTMDPVTIGLAAVTAVIAAAGALYHVDKGVSGVPPMAVSAFLKGFALVATHYTNMAALHIPAEIRYDPFMLAVSVGLAMVCALGTLSFAERLRAERPAHAIFERVVAAGLMGGCLTIMHHASMEAGRFVPDDIWRSHFYNGHHFHVLPQAWMEPWVALTAVLAVAALGLIATVSRVRHHWQGSVPSADRLTGLPNGALLRHRLERALAEGRPCAVLAVRVERYEGLAHRLGRREAEALLVRVGLRLRAAVRPDDLAARLGGADYAVLVDDPGAAEMVGQRVDERLGLPVKSGALQVMLPVVVGVAVTRPRDRPADVLHRAQRAAVPLQAPPAQRRLALAA